MQPVGEVVCVAWAYHPCTDVRWLMLASNFPSVSITTGNIPAGLIYLYLNGPGSGVYSRAAEPAGGQSDPKGTANRDWCRGIQEHPFPSKSSKFQIVPADKLSAALSRKNSLFFRY